MNGKKIRLIEPLANKKKGRKVLSGVGVSPENLKMAYEQMFILQNMVEKQIPLLQTENEKKDAEIKKLKILYKLKDEEVFKLMRK